MKASKGRLSVVTFGLAMTSSFSWGHGAHGDHHGFSELFHVMSSTGMGVLALILVGLALAYAVLRVFGLKRPDVHSSAKQRSADTPANKPPKP